MRTGYSSRPTTVRKRRSHTLTEDSPAIDPPRPAGPLTLAKKPAGVAVPKKSLTGKAPTFDARTREQGGSRP